MYQVRTLQDSIVSKIIRLRVKSGPQTGQKPPEPQKEPYVICRFYSVISLCFFQGDGPASPAIPAVPSNEVPWLIAVSNFFYIVHEFPLTSCLSFALCAVTFYRSTSLKKFVDVSDS